MATSLQSAQDINGDSSRKDTAVSFSNFPIIPPPERMGGCRGGHNCKWIGVHKREGRHYQQPVAVTKKKAQSVLVEALQYKKKKERKRQW